LFGRSLVTGSHEANNWSLAGDHAQDPDLDWSGSLSGSFSIHDGFECGKNFFVYGESFNAPTTGFAGENAAQASAAG